MKLLFVAEDARDLPPELTCDADITAISAARYLTDPPFCDTDREGVRDTDREEHRGPAVRVVNLCTDCGYQHPGYYVSMLAAARGHDPLPDVRALEDTQTDGLLYALSERLQTSIAQAMALVADPDADDVRIDLLFGLAADDRLEPLGRQLFAQLRLPLAALHFKRQAGRWRLMAAQRLAAADLTSAQRQHTARAARRFLHPPAHSLRAALPMRPSLAILRTPDAPSLPSNPEAISHFQEAAEALGMRSDVLTAPQAAEPHAIAGFDALFLRDTTAVNQPIYHLARQCARDGMVVLDDPDSILRCSNKLYLHALLMRHRIPAPRTLLLHRGNLHTAIPELGLPCVLKQPDGAFSLGVEKVHSAAELEGVAQHILAGSDLLIAQEYVPTPFDWRIGILDRRALFACRYHMARGHWQIIKHGAPGAPSHEGVAEAVALDCAPAGVIDTALRAANLIGDGFYGVDLKQCGDRFLVIEINDNPNVDSGNEDGMRKDALYRDIMQVLRSRIAMRRSAAA